MIFPARDFLCTVNIWYSECWKQYSEMLPNCPWKRIEAEKLKLWICQSFFNKWIKRSPFLIADILNVCLLGNTNWAETELAQCLECDVIKKLFRKLIVAEKRFVRSPVTLISVFRTSSALCAKVVVYVVFWSLWTQIACSWFNNWCQLIHDICALSK